MLINSKGETHTAALPKNREAREAVLHGLREVHSFLPPKCGKLFKLETRAKVKQ